MISICYFIISYNTEKYFIIFFVAYNLFWITLIAENVDERVVSELSQLLDAHDYIQKVIFLIGCWYIPHVECFTK